MDDLRDAVSGLRLRDDASWRALTSLGVGGAVPVLAEPDDDRRLAALLKFLDSEAIPFLIVGGGTNLVGSDGPAGVLALRLGKGFQRVSAEGAEARIGAGVGLSEFIVRRAEDGFGGAAALAGVPGTVGGAVAMNAGADGVEMSSIVEEVRGFRVDGSPWSVSGDEIDWSYRNSRLPRGVVVCEVSVRLESVDSASELAEIAETRKSRLGRFPRGRSAGCAFKNPSAELPAGKALDLAGCKGLVVGGAEVSDAHANFILNVGGASEKDMLDLMLEMGRRVFDMFGVRLEPEVRFVSEEMGKRIVDIGA
jgi:UDP-N-acetylmuramate dehydrogenase